MEDIRRYESEMHDETNRLVTQTSTTTATTTATTTTSAVTDCNPAEAQADAALHNPAERSSVPVVQLSNDDNASS